MVDSKGDLWGLYSEKMNEFFVCSICFMVFLRVLWFIVGLNGWLRLGDGFQYFFNIFGTFQMFTKSGPLDPLFITRTLFENIQKKTNVFPNIYIYISFFFAYLKYMDVQNLENVGKDGHRKMMNVRLSKS